MRFRVFIIFFRRKLSRREGRETRFVSLSRIHIEAPLSRVAMARDGARLSRDHCEGARMAFLEMFFFFRRIFFFSYWIAPQSHFDRVDAESVRKDEAQLSLLTLSSIAVRFP